MNLDHKVQYTLYKSRKRSSIRIKISIAGVVEVYAPSWCSKNYIDEIVAKKYDWIRKKLEIYDAYEPKLVHRYCDGDIFYLYGNRYTLKTHIGDLFSLKWEDGILKIAIPSSISSDPQVYIRKKVLNWYRKEALIYLQKRVEYWTTIHEELIAGSVKDKITVRLMRRRWGSCDKQGSLRFNTQILCAPKRFIDCIIIHELSHRLVFNHSREFKALVHSYIPDYSEYMNDQVKRSGLWNII